MKRKSQNASGLHSDKEAAAIPLIDSAVALKRQGKTAEAERHYRAALELHPGNPVALMNLGLIVQQAHNIEEADRLFSKLVRLEPKNTAALTALAHVRLDQQRRAEAISLAEKALCRNPLPPIVSNIGIFYREAGLQDEAVACFSAAIAGQPDHIPAYFNLQQLQKIRANDPRLFRLLELERQADTLPVERRAMLHFTLGNAFFDQGDPENAFHHYTEGNRLQRSTYSLNIDRHEEYLDSIVRLFDRSAIDRLRGKCGIADKRPIFIVGMPRSGSSLIDQILSSLPGAASVGESVFVSQSIPAIQNTDIAGLFRTIDPSISAAFMAALTPDIVDGIGGKYLGLISPYANRKTTVIDKQLFNFIWVGVLRLALPEAKIIHCVRDPLDMGLSIWQTLFGGGVQWGYDLREIGRYYVAYRRLMAHWQELFPGEFLDVRYESVVADQEGETRRLLEFCGLPWDDRCLRFFETARQVKTSSSVQVRQPLYSHAVRKSLAYLKYLAPLTEEIEKAGYL